MDDRERLVKILHENGVGDAEIERASEEGRLPTLAVEMALGGGRKHTLSAIARESGLDTAYLRDLLQAIGRATPSRGARAFTDEDIELAKIGRRMLDAGL